MEPGPGLADPGNPARGGIESDVLAVVGERRSVTSGDLLRASRLPVDSLTPEAARRFLDLLVDRELLAERAAAETWIWTAAESAGYESLRDRLLVGAVLEGLLQEARGRWKGATPPPAMELGMLVRDSVVAGLEPRWDEALVGRLAAAWAALPRPSADSSAAAQVRTLATGPRVAATDSNAVLARSAAGELRVAELLEAWGRLSPAYRVRVETPEQVRDLVANALFERVLRARAAALGIERSAAVARELERARDEIAIHHLIEREVLGKIEPDARAIERHYQKHREAWTPPLRVRVLELSTAERAAAEQLALRLRDPAEAEKLRALARRARLPWESDWTSARGEAFQRALESGPGAVLGPDSVDGQWRVSRVLEVLPSRPPTFEEARGRAEREWRAAEAERRTRALCNEARKRLGVRLELVALTRLVPAKASGDLSGGR